MCKASKPKVELTAPPPMSIPTVDSPEVMRNRNQQRRRAAASYGRESTILGGNMGGPPTGQQKTLLGS